MEWWERSEGKKVGVLGINFLSSSLEVVSTSCIINKTSITSRIFFQEGGKSQTSINSLPESEFIGFLLPYWHATAIHKLVITIQYSKMLNNALGIAESMNVIFSEIFRFQGSLFPRNPLGKNHFAIKKAMRKK